MASVQADLQLLAKATVEMSKPLAIVREQFFDVDQHVREHIYHGHELAREGEQVRMVTKILGRTQEELFEIAEGPEGTWLRTYVGGVNAGAQFVARFVELASDRTRVRIEAHVSPKGFVSGLGKLSKTGMEKLLEKLLGEHQRAIEGYTPKQPRGSLGVVMASLRELASRLGSMEQDERMATIHTLLELGCLVAIADGSADDAERIALHRVLKELCRLDVSATAMDQMVASATEVVASDGMDARCDYIGGALAALGLSELGLEVGALVALVSHGIDQHELAALTRIAAAAGIDEHQLNAVIATVDRELSS